MMKVSGMLGMVVAERNNQRVSEHQSNSSSGIPKLCYRAPVSFDQCNRSFFNFIMARNGSD